jgi:hypothetical protein
VNSPIRLIGGPLAVLTALLVTACGSSGTTVASGTAATTAQQTITAPVPASTSAASIASTRPPAAAPTSVTPPATTAAPLPPPPPATTAAPPPPPADTCGAPANPDGLNFCGRGHLVANPPADTCDYFNCIANFNNGHGYMEECNDGTYSMSGGRRGACSYHQGEERPVYQQ